MVKGWIGGWLEGGLVMVDWLWMVGGCIGDGGWLEGGLAVVDG